MVGNTNTTTTGPVHLATTPDNTSEVTTDVPSMVNMGHSTPGNEEPGNDVGAIVGGVIGALLCVGVIIALVVLVLYRRKQKAKERQNHWTSHRSKQATSHTNPSFVAALDNPALDSIPRSEGNVYTLSGQGVLWPNATTDHMPRVAASPTSTLNRDYELVQPSTLSRHYENVTQPIVNMPPPTDEYLGPWEIPRYLVKMVEKLGHGRFGHVWKGEITNDKNKPGHKEVAVKMLKDSATEADKRDFLRELEVMKNLPSHPNVVGLVACCTKSVPLLIVLEFMALGDLRAFLRSARSSHTYGNLHLGSHSLTSRDLISFAYQVVSGMSHISEHQLLHRDLAARNVLVGAGCICKVSDFGLARDVINNHIYHRKSQGPLPVRWMAPESIFENDFTTQSDVWSYGILLWEIVTLGGNPYPGMTAKEVLKFLRSCEHMAKPEHCGPQLYSIMEQCWRMTPDDRPNFSNLVVQLEQLLRRQEDCLHLDQLQHSFHRGELQQSRTLEQTSMESQIDILESIS